MNFFNRVYEIVKGIPYGRVMTYGDIAKLLGNANMSRHVGWALHKNPEPDSIPCYRVVDRFGNPSKAFAFGGKNMQIELLKSEGIEFEHGKVKKKFFIKLI